MKDELVDQTVKLQVSDLSLRVFMFASFAAVEKKSQKVKCKFAPPHVCLAFGCVQPERRRSRGGCLILIR